MYKRDWARVHATYSKRLVLMIGLDRMMTGDFTKPTFLPRYLHSCRMEMFLGPLSLIYKRLPILVHNFYVSYRMESSPQAIQDPWPHDMSKE